MIDRVVVDTNIVSFFLRAGDTQAATCAPHLSGKSQIVSFVTVGELHRWRALRGWQPAQTARLEHILAGLTIIYPDAALCRRWGELTATLHRAGTPIAESDSWIAVTALDLSVPLVTHNQRHFGHVPGLTVISET